MKKPAPGGKLSRSEIIQARLSPKLRLAAELMARSQRLTVSSLMEHLVEERAKYTEVLMSISENQESKLVAIAEVVELIWRNEESLRFVALATQLPHLLTPEEERLWAIIQATPYFWTYYHIDKAENKTNTQNQNWQRHELIPEHLQEYWERLVAGTEQSELPKTMGKKIDNPYRNMAVSELENHANYSPEIILEEGADSVDSEVLNLWAREIVSKLRTQEIQRADGSKVTIGKITLPSLNEQKKLLQKIIKQQEKKHGA